MASLEHQGQALPLPLPQIGSVASSPPYLPEEIWCHIHSLMKLRDAARAACLSHAFLRSWRCYPKLILDSWILSPLRGQSLFSKVDTILKKRSGVGLKIFRLNLLSIPCRDVDVDSWLKVAVTPGIQKLNLLLHEKCNFPCSLLSDGVKNSIRRLALASCAFRPTPELGPLRSLTGLDLSFVRITQDELESFLSNSLALETLYLCGCKEMIYLEIPCVLQRLRHLSVHHCRRLQMIENKAPNLSSLDIDGKNVVRGTLRTKELWMKHSECVCYARVELPSIMPNLETLHIFSYHEVVNTPMLPTKFVYLKHLSIHIPRETSKLSYDYFSLVSFLDASPSLQTLSLRIGLYHQEEGMQHESVMGGSPLLRQLPKHCRCDCLKNLEITGFSSTKSLVELTSCIVKSAVLLEHLTLDTLDGTYRCSEEKNGNRSRLVCNSFSKDVIDEASRAVKAIRMYIEDKVPPAAKLTVRGPCTRCHSIPASGWEINHSQGDATD